MASRIPTGAPDHPPESSRNHHYPTMADLAYDSAEPAHASVKQSQATHYFDPSHEEPILGRTNSRRRKVSSRDYDYSTGYPEPAPVAPDAPRSSRAAPPVAYRDPYQNGEAEEQGRSPRSFAARAGIVPDRADPGAAAPPVDTSRNATGETRPQRRSSDARGSEARGHRPKDLHVETSARGDPAYEDRREIRQVPKNTPVVESSGRRASADNRPTNRNIEPGVARSATVKSRPTRSGTLRQSEGSSGDWAADRSPLQRLEVKLNDISKEEKRARVQEAEQRLRDSQARKERRHVSQPMEPTTKRTSSQRAASGPMPMPRDAQVPDLKPMVRDVKDARGLDVQPRSRDQPDLAPANSTRRRTAQSKPYPQDEPSDGLLGVESPTSLRAKEPSSRQRSADFSKSDDRGVRFQNDVEDIEKSPATTDTKPSRKLGSVRKSMGQHEPPSGIKDVGEATDSQAPVKPDPIPPDAVPAHHHKELKYTIPPQTAAGIEARQKVGFSSTPNGAAEAPVGHHGHHLSDVFHRKGHLQQADLPAAASGPPRHLDEWRTATTARLTLADMAAEPQTARDNETTGKNVAWWEAQNKASGHRRSRTEALEPEAAAYDGSNENMIGEHAPLPYEHFVPRRSFPPEMACRRPRLSIYGGTLPSRRVKGPFV